MTDIFTTDERVRRYLRLARRAERDGVPSLARSFRMMARDRAPAPASRQGGVPGS